MEGEADERVAGDGRGQDERITNVEKKGKKLRKEMH